MCRRKCKRYRKSATAVFLCILQLIACYLESYVDCQEVTLNEIENVNSFTRTKQNTLTELSGGRVDGEKMLRSTESPYMLQADLNIEPRGILIIEPGVTIYAAPMVGITVRGAIKALVSKLHFSFIYLHFSVYTFVFTICET